MRSAARGNAEGPGTRSGPAGIRIVHEELVKTSGALDRSSSHVPTFETPPSGATPPSSATKLNVSAPT